MARICCIGGAHVDLGLHLGSAPVLATSNPAVPVRGVGGVAANVARVLAALGAEVGVVSVVGSDADGDRVIAELDAAGIDASGIGRAARHPTALYAAVLEPGGGLLIGLAAAELYDDLDRAWSEAALAHAAGAALVFVDANLPAAVISGIAAGLPPEVLLAADPVSQPKADRLEGALRRLDVLFAGRDEAEALGAAGSVEDMATQLQRQGPATVVVSRGPAGIVVADAGGVAAYDAIEPEQVIDVTGAGDSLLGGFLYGMLARSRAEPARWGLAAAALTVASDHPVPPDLNREAVEALL